MPDPGNALDYHRYAYVRFNPLKYEDGSGHCATLANGQADWENDYECWQLAYLIYGHGLGQGAAAASFAADWKVSPEEWLKNIASQSFADADYLRPFAERYYDVWAGEVGLPIGPVEWHQPVNPSVWLPGQGLAKTVFDDISLCRRSWQDCGRALDDASLAASSVAVGCGVTGIAPCAAIASGTSTVLGIGGTVITAFSVTQEKATSVDLAIGVTTTAVGGSWGAKPGGSMLVGFAASIVQWVWDHWER